MIARALLADLQGRGVIITASDGRLHVDAPAGVVRADQRAALRHHKPEILELLAAQAQQPKDEKGTNHCDQAGGATEKPMSKVTPMLENAPPAPYTSWPYALSDFVLLLTVDDLPQQLSLGPGRMVADRTLWLATVQADIVRGPSGPRGKVLPGELRMLRDVLLNGASSTGKEKR